jgi:hypothetical protein
MVWRREGWVFGGIVVELDFLAEDEALIWLCHLAGVSLLVIGSILLSLTSSGFGTPVVVAKWPRSVSLMSISETPFVFQYCLISIFDVALRGSMIGRSGSLPEHC